MSNKPREIIVFTKIYPGQDVDQLIELAHESGFEGYDLCLRPKFPINEANVRQRLPEAARKFKAAGLSLPMITCDLVAPHEPVAESLLAAMDEADVRLLKLGYKQYNPLQSSYRSLLDETRQSIAAWAPLAEKYGIKVCVHTHYDTLSNNCSALMSLLSDLDPRWFGAYIDPSHLLVEGEFFTTGAAMTSDYLCAVGLKDAQIRNVPKNDHGSAVEDFGVQAGKGMIDWDQVFTVLRAHDFKGVFSAHCVVMAQANIPIEQHKAYIKHECEFFKRKRAEYFIDA